VVDLHLGATRPQDGGAARAASPTPSQEPYAPKIEASR